MNDFFDWLKESHPEINLSPLQALLANSLYSISRGGGKTFLVNLLYEYEQYCHPKSERVSLRRLYYLIAHTETQAHYFARHNEMKQKEFRNVFDKEILHGIKDATIVFIDGWQQRRDAAYLWDYVRTLQICRGIQVLEVKDTDILSSNKAIILKQKA